MPLSPQQTQTCLAQSPDHGGPPVISHSHLVPVIKNGFDVLVRVLAVALNPSDYKMPKYHPVPNAIMGFDFVGIVVAAGNEVDQSRYPLGTRICGLVHGSNPENTNSGAFAEYLIADIRLSLRVPDAWSDLEGAALGGVGWVTVALAMEKSLQLTSCPSKPVPLRADGSRPPVLVYGGATATGTMACQMLASAGYDPIATCSPASSELVKRYGAVATFPYASPTCGEVIRKETKGTLRQTIDCITTTESLQCCFAALGRSGGRYACLEYAPDEWSTRKAVHIDMVLALEVMGHEIKLNGVYHRDENQAAFDIGVRWCQEVQNLLDEGRLKCHPVREISGKWEGIVRGLNLLKGGAVQGQKLVVSLDVAR